MSSVIDPVRTRIDIPRYHRMIEAGIFEPEERIELIDGELLDMPPVKPPHTSSVNILTEVFHSAGLRGRAVVAIGSPLELGDFSEPQPDLMLLAPRASRYRTENAQATDVLLLVEVSDSTIRFDRRVKVPLYARYGVREVWILDVNARLLHVHREPKEREYSDVRSLTPERSAEVAALPGVSIGWGEVFG
jgi:Uma2 family endonuclease